VINNAGFGVFAEFAATDFAIWQEQIEMMLINTARLTHAALRRFRSRPPDRQRCTLVNISSLATEFPLPYQSAYNMAKAGLSALDESLMFEVAGTGIVIIDFRPGDYRTDFDASCGDRKRIPRPDDAGVHRLRKNDAQRTGPGRRRRDAQVRPARRRSGVVRTGRFFQPSSRPPRATRFAGSAPQHPGALFRCG